jgi:hypothetical protein
MEPPWGDTLQSIEGDRLPGWATIRDVLLLTVASSACPNVDPAGLATGTLLPSDGRLGVPCDVRLGSSAAQVYRISCADAAAAKGPTTGGRFRCATILNVTEDARVRVACPGYETLISRPFRWSRQQYAVDLGALRLVPQ